MRIAGSFGADDGMFNAGVSYALSKGVGASKSALQKEVKSLRQDNQDMRSEIDTLKRQVAALAGMPVLPVPQARMVAPQPVRPHAGRLATNVKYTFKKDADASDIRQVSKDEYARMVRDMLTK